MYDEGMKKALLLVGILALGLAPSVVSAETETVTCSNYVGREKSACDNGKRLPNAMQASYCERYSSAEQNMACKNGQYIGKYNYETYCSQFGNNYSACMMPTATSAPRTIDESESGAVAPMGVSSGSECSSVSFDFSENCSQMQKILKALNFALPVVYILGIAGVVFGILMRLRTTDWKQQKQGVTLAWIAVAVLVAYTTLVLVLNGITPGGVIFEML